MPRREGASWIFPVLTALALALVLRAGFLFLAHALPLQLVLGKAYLPVAGSLVLALAITLGALHWSWGMRGEGQAPTLSAVRWFVTSLIAGAIGFLSLVDPFQRLWFDLGLGLAGGVFGILALAILALRKRAPRGALALDLVTFSLCVGLLGLELGLRAWARAFPSPMFARVGGGPSELVQRFRCKPGEVRFGFPCNSAGYYDEEFYRKQPGEPPRVVVIGDSFSVGTVPHAWHYTTIVEELTGYQVDNIGVAGIGPREYLSLLVEEALPLDPDLIVISLFVGNDLSVEDVLGEQPDSGLRAWLQRDQVLLAVLPHRMRRLSLERERLAGRSAGQARGKGSPSEAAITDRDSAAEAFPWVLDPSLEEPSLAPETYHGVEVGRALEICAQDPPSLGTLKSALMEAKRAAGEVPLAVLILPDEFQVEEALWQSILSTTGQRLERDRPQRLLMDWFATTDLPVLDLLPAMREVPALAGGRRHLYHALDTHFNGRGNEVTARALAPFLQELLK